MPFLVRGSLAVGAVMSVVAAAFPPLLLPFAGGRRGRPHNKAPIIRCLYRMIYPKYVSHANCIADIGLFALPDQA